MNFLQAHYNAAMESGRISHAAYVVANDLDGDKDLCAELAENYRQWKYQPTPPQPSPPQAARGDE